MTRCPRRAEVEAAHDGRLDAAARASIAQHQRDCTQCQVAASALTEIALALAMLPVPERDALAARRQRNHLLTAFEASPAAPAASRGRGRTALAVLATAGIAAVAMVATHIARAADPPAVVTSAVTVAPTSALWSRYDARGLTLVRLEDGDLELAVTHGSAPHRLIVILPDGVLDDIGTTFRVSVVAGRTSSVAVREGAVVMRRAGRPVVFLAAGDHWLPEPPVASAAPRPPAVLAPPLPPLMPRVPRPPVHNVIATEFRDAVSLLEAGRNAAAATALSGFLARHGDDPRAEDASYLLVLALQRIGDASATRAAAHEYLQRYPRGLRRPEAEVLVRGSP
ncbi:MAG: FecR domain-containing protein [Kofleriaceae bacterium]